jgi:signal transduction histidine kinase
MKVALEKSIPAAFAAMLFILLLICGVAYRSIFNLSTDALAVRQAHQVQNELSDLRAVLLAAEIAQGRFTITGNEAFLGPFNAAESTIAAQVASLNRLLTDPSQRQLLNSLVPVVAKRIAIGNDIIGKRRHQGFEAARAQIATGETQRLQDRVRAIVGDMISAHQDVLRISETHTRRIAQQTIVVLIVGALLAVITVGAAIYIVTRSLRLRGAAERELQASNLELMVARDQAQAADRIKSTFLATMSHELRTPLNSIIGFTGVLLQQLPGPLNHEQQKQLSMVRTSGLHLLALINDVLDISKIEAGELKINPALFDLRTSVAKVRAIVEPLADKKKLTFTIDIDPEIEDIRNDARRLEQVLINLLNNAIKFTEQGAVKLTARYHDANRHEIALIVSDTGKGIRQEDLSMLFQPFRQIESALARNYEGTGLGLAICQRLVQLMGGSISVASEWQRGSEFTVLLPASERTP